MEEETLVGLREDLERWSRLLPRQSDPRVRKVLRELIAEASLALARTSAATAEKS